MCANLAAWHQTPPQLGSVREVFAETLHRLSHEAPVGGCTAKARQMRHPTHVPRAWAPRDSKTSIVALATRSQL